MDEGVAAEFEADDDLRRAAWMLYRDGRVGLETFTPFPVVGLPDPLSRRPPALTWIAALVAVFSGAGAYALQWWTSAVDYPLDVGGRPLHSVPTFVPIAFELAVLGAAVAAFTVFLLGSDLPCFSRPLWTIDGFSRCNVDRFWLWVPGDDPFDRERIRSLLEHAHALRVVVLPAEGPGEV